MGTDYYSPLKVFHHRDKIAALRGGGYPVPIHVHFVPTNRCNQACEFCAYRDEGYSSAEGFDGREEMPRERMLSLLGELADSNVHAVEFTGGGEPTAHCSFAEACQTAQRYGLDYSLVTNGVNVVGDVREHLLSARWVRFSIDAADSDTYSHLRRSPHGTYALVRENLRNLLSARKKTEPVVGVGFVITPRNWEQVLAAARYAEEDGADNFRISAQFQNGGASHFQEFYTAARNLCTRAKRLENGRFRVFDLFSDRVADLEQRSPDYSYCGVQRLVAYVGADLNVYRCCVLAYNQRGLLGSVRGRTFGEFWNDPETRSRLDEFDARECPRCMFNAKNRTIAYALDQDPGHVNFL